MRYGAYFAKLRSKGTSVAFKVTILEYSMVSNKRTCTLMNSKEISWKICTKKHLKFDLLAKCFGFF